MVIGNKIYFRFEWVPTKIGDKKMDAKNEVKLAMMFDGGGTVEGSSLNGCWSTCHQDLRTMKSPKDDKKTKYIKDGDLAGGKFMDLMQFRSGKGEKPVDGHVTDQRYNEGGKSLLKAEGKQEGNKWGVCLLYTSDAADERASGDLGGRRVIKKKHKTE